MERDRDMLTALKCLMKVMKPEAIKTAEATVRCNISSAAKPPLSLLHAHALTHTHTRTYAHTHTHTLACTNRQGIYSELASQAYRAAVAFGGHW